MLTDTCRPESVTSTNRQVGKSAIHPPTRGRWLRGRSRL